MKKIYCNPTTTVVTVKTHNMIATSPLQIYNDKNANSEFVMEVKSNRVNYNVWDDDWSN